MDDWRKTMGREGLVTHGIPLIPNKGAGVNIAEAGE